MKKTFSVKVLCMVLVAVFIMSAPPVPGYEPDLEDYPVVIMPRDERPPGTGGKP